MRRPSASTGLSQADLMSLSRGKLFDDRDETAGSFVAQPCACPMTKVILSI